MKNDITFNDISIKPVNELEFVSILDPSDNSQSSSTFGGMSITEGLFHNGLSGFIILNDPNPDLSARLISISSLLNSGSLIKFSFSTNSIIDGSIVTTNIKELIFYVYNVSIVSNIAPGIAKQGSSQAVTYRAEFASYEGSALNYQEFPLIEDRDYVGSISDFFTDLTDNGGVMSPTEQTEDDDTNGHIVNTAQISPNIVPTHNGVWFKRKQSGYPWGKESSMPSINSLIRASLNYAIPEIVPEDDESEEDKTPSAGEENNPSYVFYQSLQRGQWNFTPIGGSSGLYGQRLYGESSQEGSGWHTYNLTMDETVNNRAEKFKLVKTADILEMEEAGVFGSSYTLIEPNWKGIYNGISIDTSEDDDQSDADAINTLGMKRTAYYHDFMSISSHLNMEQVNYVYTDLFPPVEDDEDSGDTALGPLLGNNPPNAGNSNPSFSSLTDPVYGYFDERYLNRPTPTIVDDYASSRGDEYMWQTMFDMTELPYSGEVNESGELGIKYIVDNIREPRRNAKIAYSLLHDLKEQWNRYRHSICCGTDPTDFFAMIVGFTGGNTADANYLPYGITGSTLNNFYRYSFVEVEVWPKALIPRGISASDFIEGADEDLEYYDYILGTSDINPSSGERELFIAGNSADDRSDGITFKFGIDSSSEGGQNYGTNQEQEFVVIPIDGGKKGMFTAYNTNELTNSKTFAGAGVNTDGYNYPSGFQLMPVGGMTGGISDQGTAIPPTFMGTVVRMSSQNSNQLIELKTMEDAVGISGGYTGPPGISGPAAMQVIGLLNTIMGTKNLPTPFGGITLDISYMETVTTTDDDGNDVEEEQYTSIDRDDLEERPDIRTNALPAKTGIGSTYGNQTIFLFSAENDHDGRCSS